MSDPLGPCPHCSARLVGYGRTCRSCGRPVVAVEPARPAVVIPDTRSEEEIRLAIKQALRTLGFQVWDTEQQRADPRVDAGLPDLLVLGHGVLAFVEVKSAKGKLRPAQEEFRRLAVAAGEKWCLWRSEADAVAFAASVMQGTNNEERTG